MRGLSLSLIIALAAFAQNQSATSEVGQPIPFSHKQHAEAAHLKCGDCHTMVPSGEVVTIPTGEKCMACHQQIARNSASIRDLKSYVDEKQPVPWVRMYELPSFVEFNHKAHLNADAKCETCHGPVATRDRLSRETDLSMNGCVSCHRASRASTNCATCHDLD